MACVQSWKNRLHVGSPHRLSNNMKTESGKNEVFTSEKSSNGSGSGQMFAFDRRCGKLTNCVKPFIVEEDCDTSYKRGDYAFSSSSSSSTGSTSDNNDVTVTSCSHVSSPQSSAIYSDKMTDAIASDVVSDKLTDDSGARSTYDTTLLDRSENYTSIHTDIANNNHSKNVQNASVSHGNTHQEHLSGDLPRCSEDRRSSSSDTVTFSGSPKHRLSGGCMKIRDFWMRNSQEQDRNDRNNSSSDSPSSETTISSPPCSIGNNSNNKSSHVNPEVATLISPAREPYVYSPLKTTQSEATQISNNHVKHHLARSRINGKSGPREACLIGLGEYH